jgi:SAM-dependent methyltransferase
LPDTHSPRTAAKHRLPIGAFGRFQSETSSALQRLGAAGTLFQRLVGFTDVPSYGRFLWVREALRHISDTPGRIFEAGCGMGHYAFWMVEQFPQAQLLAVDIDATRVSTCQSIARQHGLTGITFRQADLTKLDEPGPFDLIYSVDVLEHIAENREVIAALASRLTPGGHLLIRIPGMTQRRRLPDGFFDSLHEWSKDEHLGQHFDLEGLCDHLRACGLTVEFAARSSGLFGQLGFELSWVLNERVKPLYAILIPALKGLYHLDVLLGPKRQGNGIVVIGRRPLGP